MYENYREIEKKWQERWEKEGLYIAERDDTKKKFFIIFAYPGISGYLHVGHMRGYTYADVIARYKRMCGYNVLFPVGTHATGNIAINFAKRVARGEQAWIDYLKDNGCPDEIIRKLGDPAEVVKFFNKVYIEDYWKKFGFLADWRRFTTTINPDYMKFIEWQFRRLKDRGLLYKGTYYAPFCPNCGPIAIDASQTDILKGGSAEKVEYTLLKFEYNDDEYGKVYLVAATLRPETVFGQTNFWVNPDVEYVVAEVGGEKWVVSAEAVEKLKYQKENVKTLGKISGKKLVGKYCRAPMIHRNIPILPSRFAEADVGTGLVTSVPSDAPIDWIGLYVLKKSREICEKYGIDQSLVEKIEPIPIIRIEGWGPLPAVEICQKMGIESDDDPRLEEAKKIVYKEGFHRGVMNENCGKYAGMRVDEAKEIVKEEMLQSGEADVMYDLSEEVICRCGARVFIKKVDDQWFIRYSDEELTERAKEHAKNMEIYPSEYYKNMPSVLDWFQDRACARLGDWLGTPMPFDKKWIIEPISDSTLYPAYYLISKYVNSGLIKVEQLCDDFFDYVFLGVGDVNDVAKITGLDAEIIENVRRDVEYWYPLDINLGGKEHMTVHFPVFVMNHVAIMPEKYWPRGIFVHWYVVGKGGKISKSKGGAQPIPRATEKFSVDGLRLYYCHIASPFVDVVWDDDRVMMYKQRLEKIDTLIHTLLSMEDEGKHRMDSWLLSIFNRRIASVRKSMDSFDLRAAANDIYFEIPSDIRWYIKRGGKNRELLISILKKWLAMMCPFTPHFAEEWWEKVGNGGLLSASSYPSEDENAINIEAEAEEVYIGRVMDDIQEIIKVTGIKPEKIVLYVAPTWKFECYRLAFEKAALGKKAMGEIMSHVRDFAKKLGKAVPNYVSKVLRDAQQMKDKDREIFGTVINEFEVLKSARDFMQREFNATILVYRADDENVYDPHGRAEKAEPWKPAIYVE
ncbi:MAG: leucine--tRNA ligase [Thermoplasmata archaeon]|nr:MAG: leucine--tRNA ligase [Thermoplasmata archaeon]